LVDELEMHQPAVNDAATLREYRQDLAVSKFLSGLSPILRSQVRDQVLGGDGIFHVECHFLQSCVFLLELIYPLHPLLISLSCTLDVAKVMVVVADTTLEEGVGHLTESQCSS